MKILERPKELHDHISNCDHCTCGARTRDFCFVGRLLIQSCATEAMLLEREAADRDRQPRYYTAVPDNQSNKARRPGLPAGLREKMQIGEGTKQ